MNLIDRLLGRGDDEAVPDTGETVRIDEDRELLRKHEATLKAVDRVLTDSQHRVAAAINETGQALELHPHRPRPRTW
jgi:hypothetical protein